MRSCCWLWLSLALVVLGQGRAAGQGIYGQAQIGGPISPDGKFVVTCDLPVDLRTKNVRGSDRAGLCVFSSIGHAARFQNEQRLWNLQQEMRSQPGGGWPEKVQGILEKDGMSGRYIQYLGNDPKFLELALKTGRMPSVTYTQSHMVNLIFLNQEWAAVLDNNFIGEKEIRWHKREEFLRLWTEGGQGWAVVLLAPRPPAPPHNREGGAK